MCNRIYADVDGMTLPDYRLSSDDMEFIESMSINMSAISECINICALGLLLGEGLPKELEDYMDKLQEEITIKNLDGTERIITAKIECDHIIAFFDDGICNNLIRQSDDLTVGFKDDYAYFAYCPECGIKLEDNNGQRP